MHTNNVSDRTFLLIFAVFIAITPVFLGANNTLAWASNAIVISLLLTWIGVKSILFHERLHVPPSMIWPVILLYSLVCIWIFLQAAPWVPQILHHPLWHDVQSLIKQNAEGAISVHPWETITGLVRMLTYAGVFWIALQLGRDERKARLIVFALAIAILANALYALLLWSYDSKTILLYPKWVGQEEVSGTFVNRNHFAIYVAIGIILWSSLLIEQVQKLATALQNLSIKAWPEKIATHITGRTGFYTLAILILTGTLMLSRSRAGIACALLALITLILLSLKAFSNKKNAFLVFRNFSVLLILTGLLLSVGYLSAGQRIYERLHTDGIFDTERFQVYSRVLEAIPDYSLTGSGFGTFPNIFPIYRDENMSAYGRWMQAHNSYLENLLELGIPAAAMLFLTIGICMFICLKGSLYRRKDQIYPRIAFGAGLILILHSTIDFSLQISGITITFAALLGIGVAQSWSSRKF